MIKQNETEVIIECIDDVDYILDFLLLVNNKEKYLKFLEQKEDQAFFFIADDYYVAIIQKIINEKIDEVCLYRSKNKKDLCIYLASISENVETYYMEFFNGNSKEK
jgi:hypothetical protein